MNTRPDPSPDKGGKARDSTQKQKRSTETPERDKQPADQPPPPDGEIDPEQRER